jgi:hypothetical protein
MVSSAATRGLKIAVVGSFHRHYDLVMDACRVFGNGGHTVVSPSGAALIRGGDLRFEDDDPSFAEAKLQTLALERIMGADFVYVVAPDGYVGRATSYELGRLVQAAVPLFFSAALRDPPLAVPGTHVGSPENVLDRVARGDVFEPLHVALEDLGARMVERRLVGEHP